MAESVAAGNKWIPFYRRRWFVILCLLTISPIAWLPLFTGKIYRKVSGEGIWVPVKTSSRVIYILLSLWLTAYIAYHYVGRTQTDNQQQSVSQTSATSDGSAAPSNGPAMPANETAFLSAVTSGQSAYEAAANDMAKGGTRADRKNAICQALQNSTGANGWVGTIQTLSSNTDGKGVLAISIAPNVVVGTWNNAVSDIQDNTLLDQNSTVFRTASNMKEGDTVVFSGNFVPNETDCVEEQSVTLTGAMSEPAFVFQFLSVSKPDFANKQTNQPPTAPSTASIPTTSSNAVGPSSPQNQTSNNSASAPGSGTTGWTYSDGDDPATCKDRCVTSYVDLSTKSSAGFEKQGIAVLTNYDESSQSATTFGMSEKDDVVFDCGQSKYRSNGDTWYEKGMAQGKITKSFPSNTEWSPIPPYYIKLFASVCTP